MQIPLNKGIGPQDHAKIGKAANIPGQATGQYLSISPVVLPFPGRLVDLQLRVTLPTTGTKHPIILLSHGQGPSNNLSSMNGYSPLSQFFAAHGFAVLQPTHLSSRSLDFPADTPGGPLFSSSRAEDMKYILSHLSDLETSVPLIKGRLDHSRIAIVGHSAGSLTAGMLLGLRLKDPEDNSELDFIDPRIKAGVLLNPPGSGGSALTQEAWNTYPALRHPDFSHMKTPALIVGGDADDNARMSTRGPLWWTDNYTLSPAPKDMLTLFGSKHSLGGIAGWDSAEAKMLEDESPELLAVTQRMTVAWLRSQLYEGDASWHSACAALTEIGTLGKVEGK